MVTFNRFPQICNVFITSKSCSYTLDDLKENQRYLFMSISIQMRQEDRTLSIFWDHHVRSHTFLHRFWYGWELHSKWLEIETWNQWNTTAWARLLNRDLFVYSSIITKPWRCEDVWPPPPQTKKNRLWSLKSISANHQPSNLKRNFCVLFSQHQSTINHI